MLENITIISYMINPTDCIFPIEVKFGPMAIHREATGMGNLDKTLAPHRDVCDIGCLGHTVGLTCIGST